MMAPILAELDETYAGRFDVEFVDVWEDPGAGAPFRILAIPTQIFFDESGIELHRHEGFYSRAQILQTWRLLGYDFMSGPAPEA
jgi:thioredoxin 1